MSFMPSLDMDNIYSHASTVVSGMMPYVYLMGGISVGFAIVARVISAFRRG
jgi:hypothetical protein